MKMANDDTTQNDLLPDVANFDKIEEGLYLGNLTAALDTNILKALHISHILTIESQNLTPDILKIPGLHFCFIKVNDMSHEDLLSYFPKITNFISEGQEIGNVLVHCYFGVSRSACAVVAYLMSKHSLNVDDALERVKSKRWCVGPNSGFLSQLLLYQILNYKVDTSRPAFRLYRLTVAGEAFRRGTFSADRFSDIILKNDDRMTSTKNNIKCKSCRTVLLNDSAMIRHSHGESPKWFSSEYSMDTHLRCTLGIFSAPCQWMTSMKSPQGKLYCPKCQKKVGSFDWIKGVLCPCRARLRPGFMFTPSKVDLCPVDHTQL